MMRRRFPYLGNLMTGRSLTDIVLRRRKGYWAIALCAVLVILLVRNGIVPGWQGVRSDFPNYYTASRLIWEGRNVSMIYDDAWFQQKIFEHGMGEEGKFSPFPPPTAFVLLPLAFLKVLEAKRVFLLFNLLVLVLSAHLLTKITRFSFIGACNLLLLSGAALWNNFMLGQSYVLLLALMMAGYHFLLEGRSGRAGMLWGIGAAIKYFPFVFLPVLVVSKRWRGALMLILSFGLVMAMGCIVFGAEASRQFFTGVILPHLNGNLSGQSQYAVAFQSWNSFLRHVFIYDAAENPHPLIQSPAAFQIVRAAIYIGMTSAASTAIYLVRNDRRRIAYTTVIASLLASALSPASATYHGLLLVIPTALLLDHALGSRPAFSVFIVALYVAIGFSSLVMNRIVLSSAGLIWMYSRLWLSVALFFSSVWFVVNEARAQSGVRLHYLTAYPNDVSSAAGGT